MCVVSYVGFHSIRNLAVSFPPIFCLLPPQNAMHLKWFFVVIYSLANRTHWNRGRVCFYDTIHTAEDGNLLRGVLSGIWHRPHKPRAGGDPGRRQTTAGGQVALQAARRVLARLVLGAAGGSVFFTAHQNLTSLTGGLSWVQSHTQGAWTGWSPVRSPDNLSTTLLSLGRVLGQL